MTASNVEIVNKLLSNPIDLGNVKSVTTPDITYVSLSRDNPALKAHLPWAGTNKGPESIVKAFQGIGETWETKAFSVDTVIEQGDQMAMFGSFTYVSRKFHKEITSPFSLFAKISDGKISYVQFLEDTFGTAATVRADAS